MDTLTNVLAIGGAAIALVALVISMLSWRTSRESLHHSKSVAAYQREQDARIEDEEARLLAEHLRLKPGRDYIEVTNGHSSLPFVDVTVFMRGTADPELYRRHYDMLEPGKGTDGLTVPPGARPQVTFTDPTGVRWRRELIDGTYELNRLK